MRSTGLSICIRASLSSRFDDVFVVTSCTNPNDVERYINHNPHHSSAERLQELLETFKSIRNFYPDALIVSVDNSILSSTDQEILQSACDVSLNASSLAVMRLARRSRNKGVPYAVSAALGVLWLRRAAKVRAFRLHVLAGRYVLTGRAFSDIRQPGTYFFAYPQHRNVSTRYFACVDEKSWRVVLRLLAGLPAMVVTNRSVEGTVIGFPYLKWRRVDRLEIRGMVNGLVGIEE